MRTTVGCTVALLLSFPIVALAEPVTIAGWNPRAGDFHLEGTRGRVVAITLVSRYTRDELERVNAILRPEIGADVAVVTVVDFIGIPGLFHEFARGMVARSAIGLPFQFVVDEQGSWRSSLDAAPDKRVDIIVLDRQGEVRGHFVGLQQVEQARQLMRELRGPAMTASAR